MTYEVYLTRNANKSLKSLEDEMRERVKNALIKLENFPHELDVKKLKGTKNKYRVRVGNIRILIELQKDVIVVINILPRKTAYRR